MRPTHHSAPAWRRAALRTGIVAVIAMAGLTACGGAADDAATGASSSTALTTTAPTSTAPATTMAADPEIPTTVAQPSASSTELTTTTVATIAPPTSEDVVAGAVAALDRRHKLAQMLWVGFNTGYGGEAGSSTDGDAQAVLDLGVGGVFIGRKEVGLFTGDVLGAASRAPIPLLVATDGEGGRVDIWSDLADPLPPAEQMANESDPAIEAMAKAHGAELRSLGVNVNFAPMLDVRGGPNPLGDRTWSDDPNLVTDKAGAFAEGMCTAGVYPTFKHFPGHGRSDYDADLRPATTPSIDELRSFDLTPWRDLLPKMENRSLVMTGHLDVPGLTNGLPLSLDAKAMRLLRDELGYNGVAVTDELAEMGAITDRGISVPSAVEQSLIAGNDMALFFGDVGSASDVLDRLETAMDEGRLTEAQVDESVTRIMRLKLTGGCPTPA